MWTDHQVVADALRDFWIPFLLRSLFYGHLRVCGDLVMLILKGGEMYFVVFVCCSV